MRRRESRPKLLRELERETVDSHEETGFSPATYNNSVLQLQSTIGNRSVGHLLRTGDNATGSVPGAPTIATSSPRDECEQEAERVSREVMRPGGQLVAEPMPVAGGAAVPPEVALPGQLLDSDTREYMESRLQHDFSDVRIHADGLAVDSARELGAQAYTVGRHIVFGSGRYAPATHAGKSLLAHELAHVVQQRGRGAVLQRQARPIIWEEDEEPEKPKGAEPGTTVTPASLGGGPSYNPRAHFGEFTKEWMPGPEESWEQLQTQAYDALTAGRILRGLQIFERMREMPGRSAAEYARVLDWMAHLNFRVGRYATSIIYYEQLAGMDGAPPDLRKAANTWRRRCLKALGIPEGEGKRLGSTEATKLATSLIDQAKQADSAEPRRPGAAIQLYERVRQLAGPPTEEPKIPREVLAEAVLGIADCNYYMERYATAIIYYEQCAVNVNLGPRLRGIAQERMERCRRYMGVPEKDVRTIPEMERTKAFALKTLEELYKKADSDYKAGEYQRAYDQYERVYLSQPQRQGKVAVVMLYNMGMCALRLKEWVTAIDRFILCQDTPGDPETSAQAPGMAQVARDRSAEEFGGREKQPVEQIVDTE